MYGRSGAMVTMYRLQGERVSERDTERERHRERETQRERERDESVYIFSTFNSSAAIIHKSSYDTHMTVIYHKLHLKSDTLRLLPFLND